MPEDRLNATRNNGEYLPPWIMETIMGTRCPCGHLIDQQHVPAEGLPALPGDFKSKCGPCEVDGCECQGLIS